MSIRPFKLEISTEQMDDLHRRVRASLLPNTLYPGSWDDGTDTIFFSDYWTIGAATLIGGARSSE